MMMVMVMVHSLQEVLCCDSLRNGGKGRDDYCCCGCCFSLLDKGGWMIGGGE